MRGEEKSALRLRGLLDADPSALVRVLQHFQANNVVPTSVRAARVGASYIEIDIDIATTDMTTEALALIVAKLRQLPMTIAAVVGA